jgi:hypothetical protein
MHTPTIMGGRFASIAGLAFFFATHAAHADQIVLRNGDRLTGTIQSAADGKIVFAPSFAADAPVTIPLDQVATFSSDKTITLVLNDGTVIHQAVASAEPGHVKTASGGPLAQQPVEVATIEKINPPPVAWTGSIAANALYSQANTTNLQFGGTADANRRSETDRINFSAGYQYSEQKLDHISTTSVNNWFAQGEYDYFFEPKLFVYGNARAEQDQVNFLNMRLLPSVGAGYQWIERSDFNVSFRGGPAWLYEDYSTAPDPRSSIGLNLSYHLDKSFDGDRIKVFNDIALFPSLENLDDFVAIADGGVRFEFTKTLFSELSVNVNYDYSPAPGAEQATTQYLFGLGFTF